VPRFNHEPEYRRRLREKTEKNQHKADDSKGRAELHADRQEVIVALQNLEQQQRTYANQQRIEEDDRKGRDWRQFLVDLFGVLGLWAAAAVGIWAVLSTSHDAGIQHTDTRDAFTAVQRAFIVITPLQARKMPVLNSGEQLEWSFTPVVKNSGNTPTRDLEIIVVTPHANNFLLMSEAERTSNYSNAVQRSLQEEFLLNATADPERLFDESEVVKHSDITIIRNVVGPKDGIGLRTCGLPDIGRYMHQMWGNDVSSFYTVVARYHDVFSRNEWHITKFCYRTVAGIEIGGGVGELPLSAQCAHWNCADDECASDKQAHDKEKSELPATLPRLAMPQLPVVEPGANAQVR
jgi:hypothetical protein